MDKAPVDGKDLLPGARPREPGVGHSSGSSEMSLDEVLPGLPRLDALFPD
jgi:hypothetical protein